MPHHCGVSPPLFSLSHSLYLTLSLSPFLSLFLSTDPHPRVKKRPRLLTLAQSFLSEVTDARTLSSPFPLLLPLLQCSLPPPAVLSGRGKKRCRHVRLLQRPMQRSSASAGEEAEGGGIKGRASASLAAAEERGDGEGPCYTIAASLCLSV